jgi:hypothetical protein
MTSPEDPKPNPGPASEAAGRRDHEAASSGVAAPGGLDAMRLPGSIWLVAVAAGLLAGLASFGIGEVAPELVRPAQQVTAEERARGGKLNDLLKARSRQSDDRAAAIAYGSLGMLLGLGLGAAGGLARGSAKVAAMAGLAGLILGGAAGAGVTMLALPPYHAARAAMTDEDITQDIGLALATHGGIWIAVGAAAGLALGLGLGGGARAARAVAGGILGAAVAAVLYEFCGAVIFPLSQSFRPRAITAGPRLLAHLAVALLVSLTAMWAVRYLKLGRTSVAPPA